MPSGRRAHATEEHQELQQVRAHLVLVMPEIHQLFPLVVQQAAVSVVPCIPDHPESDHHLVVDDSLGGAHPQVALRKILLEVVLRDKCVAQWVSSLSGYFPNASFAAAAYCTGPGHGVSITTAVMPECRSV